MAQYDVDIQLAIRNKNALQGLQRELNAISDAVDAINNKSIDVTGKRRQNAIQELYRNVESASLKVLEKVDKATTNAHKNQQKVQLKLEDDLFNDKLDKINKLADAEIAASKEANEAALKDFDQRLNNRVARRKGSIFGDATARQRAGAAVSAGAFPLLFGGGPGMALGGALGGAISGKTFGPAAIALQVLGGALDQFAATAAATGQALNPLTADVNAVAEAAGYANSPFGDLLVALENNGDAAEALRLATELMAVTVGTDGADALRDFGADTVELSTEFRKAMAIMQAALASFISKTGILQGISGGIERFTLRGQIRGTLKAGGENAKRLQETLGPVSFDTGEREFTAATYDLMRKINEEKEKGLKLEAENASLLSSVGIIATNNKKIAELDANLTNQRVYTLEKSNIMQEAILEKTKEGANAKLIDLERDAKLLDLQNRRNDQIESANQKTERERQRANRALEKAEKARMRELQDRIDIAERQREKELRLEKSYTRQIDRIGNQNALLRARLDGKEEEVKKEQLIAELVEKYGKDKRAAVELLVNEQFVLEKQVKAAEEMKAVYESIGNTIQTGVVNAITAAVEGTKTLGEVASNVLRSIANQLLRLGVNQLFGSFGFGGGGGGSTNNFAGVPNNVLDSVIGERALGGAVGAGRSYLVGERGPELFVPGAQGNIVPNNAMGGASVTVNVDASGSSVEGNADQASQLGKAIGIAVQQELVKQKRPGGLLAS
nr:phage tail tape measure protein [uncultured Mediterranean phage uvMED]